MSVEPNRARPKPWQQNLAAQRPSHLQEDRAGQTVVVSSGAHHGSTPEAAAPPTLLALDPEAPNPELLVTDPESSASDSGSAGLGNGTSEIPLQQPVAQRQPQPDAPHQRHGQVAPLQRAGMVDVASISSDVPDGEGAGEAGGLREDQVQSAIQFLTHPKVQASSLQDRKNFLIKKGLTQAEIDEAIRQAQPRIDQQLESRVGGGASGSQPAPGIFAEIPPPPGASTAQILKPPPPSRAPAPPRHGNSSSMMQQQRVSAPPAPSNSWAKVMLASMAVAGVGGGLGLLTRKVLRKEDGATLGSLFGGGERAAAAAVISVHWHVQG